MTKTAPLIALILLAACSGAVEEKAADPVALVSLARADQGAISEQVTLFGTAEPGAASQQSLTAAADSIVARIVAPVGTRVGRGDVIVQLSPAPTTRLDFTKAQTEARTATAALARAERLRADGLVGNAEVETARAAARSASATVASLSGRSGALRVRALAPGYVETVTVSNGQLISAGTAVATIGQANDVRVRFGADPAVARRLFVGSSIRIAASAGRTPLSVPIASINPAADPQTRLASIFAKLPPGSGIAVGETLQGRVDVGAGSNGLTIPYAALLDDGGQPYVFVAKGGVAHRHDVAIGPATGDRIAIVKGIVAGDQVVTAGGTAVEDGMKVRTK